VPHAGDSSLRHTTARADWCKACGWMCRTIVLKRQR